MTAPDFSVVVVSYNTRDLLRRCLHSLMQELAGVSAETFVVDNASPDGSPEMVERDFPTVRLHRSPINLGFAAANNHALRLARGRYVVLLNSDAFLTANAIRESIADMDADPLIGLGGARLVGSDGSWQPSARLFPSLLNEFLILSGLSARYPHSHLFGRPDRTWADDNQSVDVDWVPGAFSIIRKSVLDEVGLFDEDFFLYYEEVDLCRRIKAAGYRVRYFANVKVVHLGGESSRTITSLKFRESGSQLAAWRMRSTFLYYRKHHGPLAWAVKELERVWYLGVCLKNRLLKSANSSSKTAESQLTIKLLNQAWRETHGGLISPQRPW